MGDCNVTIQNLRVVKTDPERGLIMIKGAVPGAKGGWVTLKDAVKKKLPDNIPYPTSSEQVVKSKPSDVDDLDKSDSPKDEVNMTLKSDVSTDKQKDLEPIKVNREYVSSTTQKNARGEVILSAGNPHLIQP